MINDGYYAILNEAPSVLYLLSTDRLSKIRLLSPRHIRRAAMASGERKFLSPVSDGATHLTEHLSAASDVLSIQVQCNVARVFTAEGTIDGSRWRGTLQTRRPQ